VGDTTYHNYVVNVLGTGAPTDGIDNLLVYGANNKQNGNDAGGIPFPTNDIFLLRRVTSIPGETPNRPALYQNSPAFVALLHGTLGQPVYPTAVDPNITNLNVTVFQHTITRLDGASFTNTFKGFITDGFKVGQRIHFADAIPAPAAGAGAGIYKGDYTVTGVSADGTQLTVAELLPTVTLTTDQVPTSPVTLTNVSIGMLSQDVTTSDPTASENVRPQEVERINYDSAINGRLSVIGTGGNDAFFSDDNSAATTLDGGPGDDLFQIGQIYGYQRDGSTHSPTPVGNTFGGDVATTNPTKTPPFDENIFPMLANSLTPQSIFGTVATTRGWLSAGATSPLVAQGGTGNNTFIVYSNQAPLRLEGHGGNNLFIVRAFALAETDPITGDIVWVDPNLLIAKPRLTRGLSTAAETAIRTGAGNNQVEYNINAPVSVDGGSGFNKLVILGTEFADHIVVTDKGIFGAGLTVTYRNIEVLEVDALEGDDTIDVLSTPPGMAVRVIGGAGNNTINVAGDVAGDVVSRDINGTSGVINHRLTSSDSAYNNLVADGIDLSVARPNQGQVIITEPKGFTDVTEGQGEDSYLVRLATAPQPGKTVYVVATTALAPQAQHGNSGLVNSGDVTDTLASGLLGVDSVLVSESTTIGALTFTPGGGLVGDTISRTTGSWLTDGYASGDLITVTGTMFNNQSFMVQNVLPLTLTLTSIGGVTTETALNATVALYDRNILLNNSTQNTAIPKRAIVLVFNSLNYNQNQVVHVDAPLTMGAVGDRVVAISHTVLSDDPNFDHALVRNVEVTIHDPNLAQTFVTQLDPFSNTGPAKYKNHLNDNETSVLMGDATTAVNDLFAVELSRAPAAGNVVQIDIKPSDPAIFLTCDYPVTFTPNAGGDTIMRNDPGGSWITDGFADNQTFTVFGAGSNNGTYTIATGGVTATTLTLTAVNQVTATASETVSISGGRFVNDTTGDAGTPPGTPDTPGVFPDRAGMYHVTFNSTNWNVPVLVTVHARLNANQKDPHNTAIILSIDPTFTSDSAYFAQASKGDKRIDVRVFPNSSPGVFELQTGGTTLVPSGTALHLPNPLTDEQTYRMRLTSPPKAPVNVGIITDGQTDIDPNQATTTTVSVTFARNLAGDTITRTSGNWVTDGFVAGGSITVSGTPGNNRTFTIQTVSPLVLTLTVAGSVTNEGPENAAIGRISLLPVGTSQVIKLFNGNITVATSNGVTTITRAPGSELGSFINDGFQPRQHIRIAVAGAANGDYYIGSDPSSVTDSTLTLALIDTLSLAFARQAGGDTITRSDPGGNWLVDGFAQGQTISIAGTGNNNGTYTLAGATATTLTLTVANTVIAGPFTKSIYPVPAAGTYNGAIIDQLQQRGVYTGTVEYHAASTQFLMFTGKLTVSGNTVSRSDGRSFINDYFAPNEIIQIFKSDHTQLGTTFTITGVTDSTLTLSGNPGDGTYAGATIDKLLDTLRRTDGTSWLDSGFFEGQLVNIHGLGGPDILEKVDLITGTDSSKLDLMVLTDRPQAAIGDPVPYSGPEPMGTDATTTLSLTEMAAQLTFSPPSPLSNPDTGNWFQMVTIPVIGDPYFDVQPGHQNLKSFPKQAHLLSGIQGPLLVSGGPTTEDRSLRQAVLLPGEANGPLFNVPPQPPASEAINTLNIYNDGTLGNPSGTLTSTGLSGLDMGGDLDFTRQYPVGFKVPFGESLKYPGGISYGDISLDSSGHFQTDKGLSTIQVLNVFLGSGNDNLNIASTLQQGAFHNADGTLGQKSEHGGITTVHGGGNSPLQISTPVNVAAPAVGAPAGTTAQLTRVDGASWSADGYAVGQQVLLSLNGTNTGSYTITGIGDLMHHPGSVLFLSGAALPSQTSPATVSVTDWLQVTGAFDVVPYPYSGYPNAVQIVRRDGLPWAGLGFAAGQQVSLALSSIAGGTTATVLGFDNSLTYGFGTALVVNGPSLAAASNVAGTVAVTSRYQVSGSFNIDPTGTQITRQDGRTWTGDGFAVGQPITINGLPGYLTVTAFDLTGAVMTVTGASLTPGNNQSLTIGLIRLGGDSITLQGANVTGTFNIGSATGGVGGVPAGTTGQIVRTDGKPWSAQDFQTGVQVAFAGTVPAPGQVGSVAINNPPIFAVTGISMDGTTLFVSGVNGAALANQTGVPGNVTVLPTGIGPSSPLVVYGDTSQDGTWYGGKPYQSASLGIFGNKPMPHDDNIQTFLLATPGTQPQANTSVQFATFTNPSGTFGTITRSSGSWINDGIVVDGLVTIDGTPVGNVQTMSTDGLSLTLTNLTPAFAGLTGGVHSVTEWNAATLSRGDGNSWLTSGFTVEGIVTVGSAIPNLTFARGASGDTIKRASGSWIADGFVAGQQITVRGTTNDDLTYTIAAGGVTTLTLTLTVSNHLTPEGPETATISADVGTINKITDVKKTLAVSFAQNATGDTISRSTGSWISDGYVAGHTIAVTGTTANNGTFTIANVTDLILTLTAIKKVTVEPDSAATISDDTLSLFDLTPFFLTSTSGIHTVVQRNRLGENADFFVFPLAEQYTFAGNNFIDGHLLDARVPNGQLPSIGFIAYGGAGNDTIIGSQAGDMLAGGSGNNVIEGGRGQKQIYGAAGFNVNVITRVLTVATAAGSSNEPDLDPINPGNNLIYADAPGSSRNDTFRDFNSVIFGALGDITQEVSGARDATKPLPALPQRIQTTLQDRQVVSLARQNHGDNYIYGNGGESVIIGGGGNNTIDGGGVGNDSGPSGPNRTLIFAANASLTRSVFAIISANWSNGTATITTNAPNGFVTGELVTIADMSPLGFNGTFAVTVTSPTTFTYALATNPGAMGTTFGSATPLGNFASPRIQALKGTQIYSTNPPAVSISSATWANNTATITTSSAHGFTTGQFVTISGVAPSAYDGGFVITVTSPTTFTYTLNQATNPGAGTAFGVADGGPPAGQDQTNGVAQLDPRGHAAWGDYKITLFDMGKTTPQNSFGNDYIAGGAGDNEIFGEMGSDVVQGAGSIDYVSHLQESLVITSATWLNNTVTITTKSPHGFVNGETVTISGVAPTAYNGAFAITVTSPTTFTYALPLAANPGTFTLSPSSGSALANGLDAMLLGGRIGVLNNTPLTITTASWSSVTNTVTITTNTPHALVSGESTTIAGIMSNGGVAPTGYNGTYVVTLTSPTTFTYSLATNPGIYSGGGTVGNTEGNPFRDAGNALKLRPSYSNTGTDGQDYIEGGGGNNIIFGNPQGQNDIIGGSSDLFSLTTPDLRNPTPAYMGPNGLLGHNLIFGGSGTDNYRNDYGDTSPQGHARNADTIISNNGDILRLVGVTVNNQTMLAPTVGIGSVGGVATYNGYLAFNYDNYSTLAISAASWSSSTNTATITTSVPHGLANGDSVTIAGVTPAGYNGTYLITVTGPTTFTFTLTTNPGGSASSGTVTGLMIIPRAARLLDYTPGGPAYAPTAAQAMNDIGGLSEIHGENGDKFIFGEGGFNLTGTKGNVIYGGGQYSQIVGGYGNNWISGGAGPATIIGQDGRIFTSRNGLSEPLNGVAAIPANQLNLEIFTPGHIQDAIINVAGQLKSTVDLEPFSEDITWNATTPEWNGGRSSPHQSDDIIFGGLGSDVIHGGSGDVAISGAEALPLSYLQTEDKPLFNGVGGNLIGIAESDWYHPFNPSDALRFNPDDPNRFKPGSVDPKPIRGRVGQFALYDEFDPRRKISLNADGTANKTLNFTYPWFLSLDQSDRPGGVVTDGNKALFGDLGQNWIVGGTGTTDSYGGFGNDLLDPRASQDTDGFLNDVQNTAANYTDRAFGGAGKDVLIADTTSDRLIDWVGEFNSYITPWAPFGMPQVSRTLQPQLPEFLYNLSKSDGSDQTLAADYNSDPARNGEPFGELGLVRQHDAAWHFQVGPPSDPQAGNNPGSKRVTIKSSNLSANKAPNMYVDSGTWTTAANYYQGAAATGGDAVSLFDFDQFLPSFYEYQTNLKLTNGGTQQNAFLIFDYQGTGNFKYAGLDASQGLLRIGQRSSAGWVDTATLKYSAKINSQYNPFLRVNGATVTFIVSGSTLSYTFSNNLNTGLLGIGTYSAVATYTWEQVQQLPHIFTYQVNPSISGTGLSGFTVHTGTASVNSTATRYTLTPPVGDAALSTRSLNVQASSYVEYQATVNAAANGTWAGLVFAYSSSGDYLFAAVVPGTNQVVLGHRNAAGWFTDAVASTNIAAGTDYTLLLALDSAPVSGGPPNVTVVLNGASVLSFNYNIQFVGGANQGDLQLGLLARYGAASFYALTIRGDDPAYANGGTPQLATALAPPSYDGAKNPLTPAQLGPVVEAAIERWSAVPGMSGDATLLHQVPFALVPLSGRMVGETIAETITIDPTAAGYGWFVDSTPLDDSEFAGRLAPTELTAGAGSPASGRMDLLTVVMHELGHILGFGDVDTASHPYDLMATDLAPGVRRLPNGLPDNLAPAHAFGNTATEGMNLAPPSFERLLEAGRALGIPQADLVSLLTVPRPVQFSLVPAGGTDPGGQNGRPTLRYVDEVFAAVAARPVLNNLVAGTNGDGQDGIAVRMRLDESAVDALARFWVRNPDGSARE
jgi:hypothetical protein